MEKSKIYEIYDRNYAKSYNKKFIFSDCHADFEEKVIKGLLNEFGQDTKWLDVACGTGYFLSRFPDVKRCGLDISSAMLDVARKDNPGVNFVQADFKDKCLHWENQWDFVSCMWWAYSYVESLPELEQVIENLACWTSDRGALFLPVGNPDVVTVGEVGFPYTISDVGVYGGKMKLEGLIWTWIDEDSDKRHEHLIAPHTDYLTSLLSQYFDRVDVIEYPEFKTRKAIIAREKKKQTDSDSGNARKQGKALSVFSESTRIKNWWSYKIPPLLGIAYALLLLGDYTIVRAATIFAVIISTSIGAAGYGHFINDICDIETDQKANKPNAAAQLQPWQRLLLCSLFISTGFVVPLLTHLDTIPLALLAANYLLPTLYSIPPLRLKERGIWGILSDAAGAHLIPTLFVAATVLSQTPNPSRNALIFTGIAAAHAFFVGLRGILLHQLWDRANDLNSGITTFVTQQQPETAQRWINRFVFPVELLLLGGVALLLCQSTPALTAFFFVYLLFTAVNIKTASHPFTPSPPKGQNIVPHDLYEVWLPLTLAITLAVQNPLFLVFVALTAILFYPSLKVRTTELFQVIKAGFMPMPNLTPLTAEVSSPTLTNVAPLIPEMQQQLETEGYVVLENFLTTDELEDLREFDRTLPLPEDIAALCNSTNISSSNIAYRQKVSDRLKSTVNPKLNTLLPNHRAAFCTWYRKSPNSSTNATQLHQDPSLTTEPETLAYGIWCPLVDVDSNNGCLHVVKGSHTLNSQPRTFHPFSLCPYNDTLADLLQERYLTPIPLKAGQAILYDKRLFHSATANPTATERVAFTCLIAPADQPTYFGYCPSSDSDTLELFAVQDEFYNRYSWGDRPDGDGVKLIKTEPYTYDPITPEILAEKLDPLHPERTSTDESDSSPSTVPEALPTPDQPQPEPIPSDSMLTSAQLEQIQDYLLTSPQTEKFSDYLKSFYEQLQRLQSNAARDRYQTQTELANLRSELAQTEAARQAAQAEATQLQAFLHTQGSKVVMDYYCQAIAANPNDLQLYGQAIALNPSEAQLHLQLGRRLIQQGQLDAAISRYQTAIQHCPNHFDLHLELAKTLETARRWEEAISAYQAAIALNPNNPEALQHLGNVLAQQGQINEASIAYRRSLQMQDA